jgi:lipopolysaccharide transport system permease protein
MSRLHDISTPNEIPEIIIKPDKDWRLPHIYELWQYRDLARLMVLREVQGRYRQMAFGPLWIILTPLINMLVFSLVFGQLARLPSDGIPYPVFSYTALLPWTFFSAALSGTASSLVKNMNLISKVYFPRLIIPVASVLGALVDFLASFLILLMMVLIFGMTPTWGVLALPLFLVLAACTALAIGLWLAALAVRFRDVSLGLSYGIQVWMYLSPVVYPTSLVPARLRIWYQLNPMTVVLDGFRWGLLGTRPPDWLPLIVSSMLVMVLLISGVYFFNRTQTSIVDLL